MWLRFLLLLLMFGPAPAISLALTDEIQDADPAQSGYLPNHNLHPSTVSSSIFGILWKNTYGTKEYFYAKPLTYTPKGSSRQLVFLASAMNIIRTVDAANGTLINQRLVQPPFLQSDMSCADIPNFIGIIGTPIIDPDTDTVYFFSKGYEGGASGGGVALGRYKLYSVDINTLDDRPGFPVLIDGHNADNDPAKYFVGGTVLQRPSLIMMNGVVIGGFGGHCDLFNYTGMLVAVSTTSGVGITSIYAMEGGPGAQPEVDDISTQQGGKAGIWQGGMGLTRDGSRIFLATGNGQGHANGDIPTSGRVPLATLDEVVADFSVSPEGKFSLTDYFEPYEYVSMDASDRDLGSAGVALLDPDTFQGTGVSRIAVSVGKNGKAYILNADNLGGFKQGPGGTDNAIQTIVAQGAVFAGAGSYPLEGGYIYFTPVGLPTVCYKFGKDSIGRPLFTLVGQTATKGAGRVGIGVPTVTSYQGQAGTGIVWIVDPNAGLQAFNAVPDSNGVLTQISIPPTNGMNKFQRPGFGNGRVYVSDTNGNVYCFGTPVALPLQCSQPVDFGQLLCGRVETIIVNCTALISINSIDGCITGDHTFQCTNSTLPRGPLARGATFAFPVTWNLTEACTNDDPNVSFGTVIPGGISSSLTIRTTNGVPKYSNAVPVTLQGTMVSEAAFLTIAPLEVDFGGIVIKGSTEASALQSGATISNIGSQDLIITGVAWTDTMSDPPIYNNLTINPDGSTVLGFNFSSPSFVKTGDILAPKNSVAMPLFFNTNVPGLYRSLVQIWSNGGDLSLLLVGDASTAPIINVSVSTAEGGWDFSDPLVIDFGDVSINTSMSRNIRLCNAGGSGLTITKSKPPIDPELFAARPLTDLHEGQTVGVNSCAFGEVDVAPATVVVNQPPELLADVWVLNADGLMRDGTYWGVHEVQIRARIIRRQIGPLLPDGSARYKYLGCYEDVDRILPKLFNGGQNNENSYCQNTCLAKGYIFAGTEYHVECWCGNTPPPSSLFHYESEKKCTLSCSADTTQSCGGNGGYISVFYDSLKYTPSNGTTNNSSTMISTLASTLAITSFPSTTTSSTSQPSMVAVAGVFSSVGCYTEATAGRALTGNRYANDNMTVEICAATCAGFAWMGVEYARECYCGNTISSGSIPTNSGCNMVCKANASEYCGGSSRLNMYQAMNLVSSPSSPSPTPISSSSVSSAALWSTPSVSPLSLSSTAPSSAPSPTNFVTSSSSSGPSAMTSSTASTYSPSTVLSETSLTSSTTLSATSSSTSPTSSLAVSSSSLGTSLVLSLNGSSSLGVLSSTGSSTAAPSRVISFPSVSSGLLTASPTAPTTFSTVTSLITFTGSSRSAEPTLGFYPIGCFADPVGGEFDGHIIPLLFRNDSVSVELCIQVAHARLAANPATTYNYIGLEYGRECYAATAAPTVGPATVTGPGACTMACSGNRTEKCGGNYQLNVYTFPRPTPS